jgi:S1-C subfamily serine protease
MSYGQAPQQPTGPEGGSAGPGWGSFTALALVLLLLVGAGFGVLYLRLDTVIQDAAAAQESSATLQLGIQDAQTRLAGLEDLVANTQDRVTAVDESVQRVDESVQEQAERSLDVGSVRERVLPSVVSVYCETPEQISRGSGFAVQVDDPPSGFPTGILTNYHVI